MRKETNLASLKIGFSFYKIDQKVKTELVVFVNPTIVTDAVINAQLQPEDQLSEKARQKLEQLENKTR